MLLVFQHFSRVFIIYTYYRALLIIKSVVFLSRIVVVVMFE